MKFVIDTCSLTQLVKAYLPFDKGNVLYDHFKKKMSNGNIIYLDKVHNECEYISQGLVLEKFDFLKKKEIQTGTGDIIADMKFQRLIVNTFVQKGARRKFGEAGFEKEKRLFFDESADAKIILYCKDVNNQPNCIITEESVKENDGKPFKKIPVIADYFGIRVITIADYLDETESIEVLLRGK